MLSHALTWCSCGISGAVEDDSPFVVCQPLDLGLKLRDMPAKHLYLVVGALGRLVIGIVFEDPELSQYEMLNPTLRIIYQASQELDLAVHGPPDGFYSEINPTPVWLRSQTRMNQHIVQRLLVSRLHHREVIIPIVWALLWQRVETHITSIF
jgi:hypothetical protein